MGSCLTFEEMRIIRDLVHEKRMEKYKREFKRYSDMDSMGLLQDGEFNRYVLDETDTFIPKLKMLDDDWDVISKPKKRNLQDDDDDSDAKTIED